MCSSSYWQTVDSPLLDWEADQSTVSLGCPCGRQKNVNRYFGMSVQVFRLPVAAAISYHKLGGLIQSGFILSQSGGWKSWNLFHVDTLRENQFYASLLTSPGCWQALVFLGLLYSNLCLLSLYMALSLLIFVFSHLLLRIPATGVRSNTNPLRPHLFYLVTSAKTLFPSKVTFWDSERMCVLWGHYSTHYTWV